MNNLTRLGVAGCVLGALQLTRLPVLLVYLHVEYSQRGVRGIPLLRMLLESMVLVALAALLLLAGVAALRGMRWAARLFLAYGAVGCLYYAARLLEEALSSALPMTNDGMDWARSIGSFTYTFSHWLVHLQLPLAVLFLVWPLGSDEREGS